MNEKPSMQKILLTLISLFTLTSLLFSQFINPTLSIRYEDFMEEFTPELAIGVKIKIDKERYTGFETTQNSETTDSRIIIGWNWAQIGLGAKTVDDEIYPSYTFGATYSFIDGLSTNIEYVMTEPEAGIEDHLRLALLITF